MQFFRIRWNMQNLVLLVKNQRTNNIMYADNGKNDRRKVLNCNRDYIALTATLRCLISHQNNDLLSEVAPILGVSLPANQPLGGNHASLIVYKRTRKLARDMYKTTARETIAKIKCYAYVTEESVQVAPPHGEKQIQ